MKISCETHELLILKDQEFPFRYTAEIVPKAGYFYLGKGYINVCMTMKGARKWGKRMFAEKEVFRGCP